MDKMVLKAAIEKIEAEKAIHDQKFAGQEIHKDCIPRFETVLAKLRADADKEGQGDQSV
jgi:hypothetical protein